MVYVLRLLIVTSSKQTSSTIFCTSLVAFISSLSPPVLSILYPEQSRETQVIFKTRKSFAETEMLQQICVINQAWGQDGWILAESFFGIFMDRYDFEVHKIAKNEWG